MEEVQKATGKTMALRQKLVDAEVPDDLNECAARLQALALFDIAVILSSPIVEAVQEPEPGAVPLFAAGARPPDEVPPTTPESLLRWAQAISARGHHPTGSEWDAWWRGVEELLGPLPPPPQAG